MIKGQFVSVWNEGTIISTPAKLYRSGEVTTKTVETGDLGSLEREYFEDEAGNEYEVCTECHSHILKTAMNPIGHDLNEEQVCSNPDCETNQ